MAIMNPILIAGPPRSGTTMLAGLLIKHGVWIGESHVTKHPETNSMIGTENIFIKSLMKKQGRFVNYKNWRSPLPSHEDIEKFCDWNGVAADIKSVVPENQKWLVKTSWLLIFYEFWVKEFPGALWVLPDRTTESIIDSINRHPAMQKHTDREKYGFVNALHARQQDIRTLILNSMYVDVKNIASLQMWEIERFFHFCDVDMDEKIVRDFIKPEKMK